MINPIVIKRESLRLMTITTFRADIQTKSEVKNITFANVKLAPRRDVNSFYRSVLLGVRYAKSEDKKSLMDLIESGKFTINDEEISLLRNNCANDNQALRDARAEIAPLNEANEANEESPFIDVDEGFKNLRDMTKSASYFEVEVVARYLKITIVMITHGNFYKEETTVNPGFDAVYLLDGNYGFAAALPLSMK